MSGVTLNDLKFIEDPKHRKAFLIALREVEEEGFDALSLEEGVRKMKGLEKAHVVHKDKQTAMDNALKAIGSSPRERATSSMIKKRNFTHTNAVDLKDYKYWRDPDFDKKQGQVPKSPFSSSFDDSFESVFNRREGLSQASPVAQPKPKSSQSPSKPKSLYDELFADIVKDHEVVKTKEKTQTYKDIERIIDGNAEVKPVNTLAKKPHVNKYSTPEYAETVKKRVAKFQEIQEQKRLAEEEAKREIARKKLQAEKVEKEAALAEDELNKGKTKKSDKLTVEIIGVDEKPKTTTKKSTTATTKKKTSTASTTTKSTAKNSASTKTATKPRKRKKKLDADIKLYRNIHID